MSFCRCGPIKAEIFQRVERRAVDQNGGLADQPAQNVRALAGLEVERDAALGEIVMPEIKTAIGMRLVVVKGSDFARRTAAGRLDLDNVGSGAGEELAAELAFLIAQFKHANVEQKSI